MKIYNNEIKYDNEKAIAIFEGYQRMLDMNSGLLESIATYSVLTETGEIFTGVYEDEIEE